MKLKTSVSLISSLLLTACATTSTQTAGCPEIAPVEAAAAPASAGLDAQLLKTAQTAQGVHKFKLFFDDQGRFTKQSVYHRDPSLLPDAVKKTVEAEAPGAELLYCESELYQDAGRVFEVQVKLADGNEMEVSAREDGTLYYTERKIDPKLLSEPVRKVVEETVPGGKIEEVELKKGPGKDATAVEVIDGAGVMHYLTFAPGGKLVKHTLRFVAQVEVPAP